MPGKDFQGLWTCRHRTDAFDLVVQSEYGVAKTLLVGRTTMLDDQTLDCYEGGWVSHVHEPIIDQCPYQTVFVYCSSCRQLRAKQVLFSRNGIVCCPRR